MRAVIQRVSSAAVHVDGQCVGSIGRGIVVLLGIARGDTHQDAEYLVDRIIHLRIFPDQQGKMNRSLMDIGGSLLVVSQFTLLGDCRRGRRPSFDRAAPPDHAKMLYEYFLECAAQHVPVSSGIFQAMMAVQLINDGPVTFFARI